MERSCLCIPPRIALWQQIGEEELELWYEVPLDEQDGACFSSQIGCKMYYHNVLEVMVMELTISTRALGAHWDTIPSCWSSHSVKKEWVSIPRLNGSRQSARGTPMAGGASNCEFDVLWTKGTSRDVCQRQRVPMATAVLTEREWPLHPFPL